MCNYLINEDIDTPKKVPKDQKIGDEAINAACSEDEQDVQNLRKNLSEISDKKTNE